MARGRPVASWLSAGIFSFALLVRLIGILHADNTWDEYFYYDAARSYAKNVVSRDFESTHWLANNEHPPVGKYAYLPAIGYNKWRYGDAVPADKAYDSGRITAAILGALTTLTLFAIGKRLFPLGTAALGALIYAILPPVVGYHRILGLDAPLVLLMTLAVYFLVRGIKEDRSRHYLWAGLLGAFAFATKFNGLLILSVLFGGYLVFRWEEWRKTGKVTVPLTLLLTPLLFPAVLVALWPWLWQDSLDHFAKTLLHWGGSVPELWLGKVAEGPWYYFLFHFLVSVPGLSLLAMAVFVCLAWRSRDKERLFVLLWFLVPFLFSVFHLRQDRIRYVLPAYPAFALLVADGVTWVWGAIKARGVRAAFAAALSVYFFGMLAWVAPYYLDYFNELIGFPKLVAKKGWFELGFYGEGIREATEHVNRIAPPGATVHFEVIPDDNPYLDRTTKKLVRFDQKGADYLVVNSRAKRVKPQAIDLSGYREIYSVTAMDAPFVWVYQRE